MQNNRRAISPFLYYIIISSSTTLAFILVAAITFAFFFTKIQISGIGVAIILGVLLWKGGLVGVITGWAHKKSRFTKEFAIRFIGFYLGRFFGLLIGAFVGVRIARLVGLADIVGLIVGALSFYFAGRWLGPRVSFAVGGQLDKVVSLKGMPEQEEIAEATPPTRFAFVLYAVVIPAFFVVFALLVSFFAVQIHDFAEWLPVGRIVAIAVSAISILYPWLMRKRLLAKFQPSMSKPEIAYPWIGLTLSIVPTIYGFALFVGFGASIIEMCLFAVTSSIAAAIWGRNIAFKNNVAG